MSRRRPILHTFGASILAIVHNACERAQGINGPVGSLTRRTTKFISPTFPYIYSIQYQYLAILSFADDHILTFENMVETIFPPSMHLFDGIDKLVYRAEYLPGRFDDALNAIPTTLHRLPFLDWAVMHSITCLDFLMSHILMVHCWGSKKTQEKDIMIDIVCNNNNSRVGTRLEISIDYHADKTNKVENAAADHEAPPAESSKGAATYVLKPFQDEMRCSYKEILEKGTKRNGETKDQDNHNNSEYDTPRSTISEGGDEMGRDKEVVRESNVVGFGVQDDPILQLYEASRHLK